MDDEELRNWLQDKPRNVAVAIAARAALRVVPLLPLEFGNDDKAENLTFPSLRCLLISSLTGKMPSANIKKVAFSAANSVRSAALFANSRADSANSATDAANSAADAAGSVADSARSVAYSARSAARSVAYSVRSANFQILSEVEWDMRFIESVATNDGSNSFDVTINHDPGAAALMNKPLFNVEVNDWGQAEYDRLNTLADEHPEYTWWVDWLNAMHDGTFTNWSLAEKIALLPNKEWKKDAEHIANEIERLSTETDKKNSGFLDAESFHEASSEDSIEEPQKKIKSEAQRQSVEVFTEAILDAPTLSRVRAKSQAVSILSFCHRLSNQVTEDDEEYPALTALKKLGISFDAIATLLEEVERLTLENQSLGEQKTRLENQVEAHIATISELTTALSELRGKRSSGKLVAVSLGAFSAIATSILQHAIEIDPFVRVSPNGGPVNIETVIPDALRAYDSELCEWQEHLISCDLAPIEYSEIPPPPSRNE